MPKKAISVRELREWANTRLATPNSGLKLDDFTPDQAFRLGIASFIEQILHSTGNYHGFAYLEREVRDDGTPEIGDETRRAYLPGRP